MVGKTSFSEIVTSQTNVVYPVLLIRRNMPENAKQQENVRKHNIRKLCRITLKTEIYGAFV